MAAWVDARPRLARTGLGPRRAEPVAVNCFGEPATQAATGSGIERLAFFGQLREGKGILVFVEGLRALESELLNGVDLLFLGRETPRWTSDRIRDALGPAISERVSSIRFETRLERSAALQELLLPGTLAVMPSLLDNSPYAVAECIEHGIPFVATSMGGIPELVAEDDRARMLCQPTPDDLAAALRRALTDGAEPARAARPPDQSLAAWLELIESITPARQRARTATGRVAVVARGEQGVRRARRLAEYTRTVEVDVVPAASRSAGLKATDAEWVVFLDDDDTPDDGMLDALAAAQAASDADVVTAAVRPADDLGEVQLFLGDAGVLGRREPVRGPRAGAARSPPPAGRGRRRRPGLAPLFPARAFRSRRRIGSRSLVGPLGQAGTVGDVPGDGLSVLQAFEERAPPSRRICRSWRLRSQRP